MNIICLAFIYLSLTYLNAQFIKQYGSLTLYEFTAVNKFENESMSLQPFTYLINDQCSDESKIIEDEGMNAQKKVQNLNADFSIYQSYNFNLRFILSITFDSPLDEDGVDGYEIRITHDLYGQSSTCMRIIKSYLANDKRKTYNIKIKDPVNIAGYNWFLYLGQITLTSLRYCHSNDSSIDNLCVLKNTSVETPRIQITKEDEEIKSLYFPKFNCDTSPIRCNCIRIVKDGNMSFGIVATRFPWYVGVIENTWLGSDLKPSFSYIKETIDKIMVKIYKITYFENEPLYFSNVYVNKSEDNYCSDDKFCKKQEIYDCLKCNTSDEDAVPIKNYTGAYQDDSCIDFVKNRIALKFQNKNIDEMSEKFDGYHLIDMQPSLCISFNRTSSKRSDQIIDRIKLQFNDSSLISKSSLFKIDYNVSLLNFICDDDKTKNANELNGTTNSSHVKLIIKNSKSFINSHEFVYFDDLQEGYYAIEVIPNVDSTDCGTLCLYIMDLTARKFSCEECRKLVYLFEISSNSKVETTCLETISNTNALELSYDIEKMLSIHNETVLLPTESKVVYPLRLLSNLKCPRIPKSSNNYGIIIGLLVFLIICVVLIAVPVWHLRKQKPNERSRSVVIKEDDHMPFSSKYKCVNGTVIRASDPNFNIPGTIPDSTS